MKIGVSLTIWDTDGGVAIEETRERTVPFDAENAVRATFAKILSSHTDLVSETQAAFDAQAARWMDVLVGIDPEPD